MKQSCKSSNHHSVYTAASTQQVLSHRVWSDDAGCERFNNSRLFSDLVLRQLWMQGELLCQMQRKKIRSRQAKPHKPHAHSGRPGSFLCIPPEPWASPGQYNHMGVLWRHINTSFSGRFPGSWGQRWTQGPKTRAWVCKGGGTSTSHLPGCPELHPCSSNPQAVLSHTQGQPLQTIWPGNNSENRITQVFGLLHYRQQEALSQGQKCWPSRWITYPLCWWATLPPNAATARGDGHSERLR